MSIKNLTPEHKLTLQLVLAVFLTVAGVVLLFMGFWAPPIAEICLIVLSLVTNLPALKVQAPFVVVVALSILFV